MTNTIMVDRWAMLWDLHSEQLLAPNNSSSRRQGGTDRGYGLQTAPDESSAETDRLWPRLGPMPHSILSRLSSYVIRHCCGARAVTLPYTNGPGEHECISLNTVVRCCNVIHTATGTPTAATLGAGGQCHLPSV
jgi:hypothetical protein